jgi:hypothetical protein
MDAKKIPNVQDRSLGIFIFLEKRQTCFFILQGFRRVKKLAGTALDATLAFTM